MTTDAELAGCERHHPGDFLDDAATDTACRLLASLEERDRRELAEIDAAEERLCTETFGTCEACARMPELDLKLIAHHGAFAEQAIAGSREVVGTEVIVAHRLLKNDVAASTGVVHPVQAPLPTVFA